MRRVSKTGCASLAVALALATTLPAGAEPAPVSQRRKIIAAASVAALYGGVGAWAYLSWFHKANTVPFYFVSDWEGENPFSLTSYAGGSDKFGHMWANYALARGTTALLRIGGWDGLGSSLIAAGLTEAAFTLSEIKDGFVFGFEVGDLAANFAGAGLSVLMENVPVVDRLFDFRIEYFPSSDYRFLVRNGAFFQRKGGVDIAQDYSGMSYMLAFHLREVAPIVEMPATRWLKYVDVVAGFETRGYEPMPEDPLTHPRQTFYFGASLNLQAVLDSLLPASTVRTLGHGLFETVSVPFNLLPLVKINRFRH